MSLLAAPTPALTLLSRANIEDRFFLSNPESPEHNVVLRDQEITEKRSIDNRPGFNSPINWKIEPVL